MPGPKDYSLQLWSYSCLGSLGQRIFFMGKRNFFVEIIKFLDGKKLLGLTKSSQKKFISQKIISPVRFGI